MLQFTISSEVLANTLADLHRVINHKTAMPVLEGFLVRMDETGRIHLTAKDGAEYAMAKTIQADRWDGQGEFVANSRQLLDALNGLPEQDVILSCQDVKGAIIIRIKYNGGELSFEGMDVKAFPSDDKRDADVTEMSVTGQTLIEGISRVLYAVARDDSRPVMSGVYMERKGDTLTFASTDGRMLSYTDRQLDCDGTDVSAILSVKLCNIIRASIRKGQRVNVGISNEHIYVDYGSTKLSARVIEGRYPNYRGVVPQDNPYHIEVDKRVLLATIKRVGAFTNASSQLMSFEYSTGRIKITGKDIDLFARSLTETISIKSAWADKGEMPDVLRIGLSASYLQNVLINFGSEVVELQIADPSRPVVFRGDSAISLLMPMLLEEEKPMTEEPVTDLEDDEEETEIEDDEEETEVADDEEETEVADDEEETEVADDEEETEIEEEQKAELREVDVTAMLGALKTNGEVRLSDYSHPVG